MIKLKKEVIETIKTTPILYGKMADAIGCAPASMVRILKDNSPKLRSYKATEVLKEHYKIKSIAKLLEEENSIV